jgi:hypothetical protein
VSEFFIPILPYSHTFLMFFSFSRILHLIGGICQRGISCIIRDGRGRNNPVIGSRIYWSGTSLSTGINRFGRTGRITMTWTEKHRYYSERNQAYFFHKIIFRYLSNWSAESESVIRKWLKSLIHINIFPYLVSIFVDHKEWSSPIISFLLQFKYFRNQESFIDPGKAAFYFKKILQWVNHFTIFQNVNSTYKSSLGNYRWSFYWLHSELLNQWIYKSAEDLYRNIIHMCGTVLHNCQSELSFTIRPAAG